MFKTNKNLANVKEYLVLVIEIVETILKYKDQLRIERAYVTHSISWLLYT